MNSTSESSNMAGKLFLPSDYHGGAKPSVVLVVGPRLNVKEQVATNPWTAFPARRR